MARKKPLALFILDGWGMREEKEGNAILTGDTRFFHRLWREYPHVLLQASGEAVGLPQGQMGNSEVGHLNMGAGRIVYQELTRISKAIREGEFFCNPVLLEAVAHVKRNNSALHLMGLLSDGGVHSHIEHLFALLELARRHDLPRVYVHCFLDGRDVPPQNAAEYITALEEKIREIGVGVIASISGRYYAMDRDKRWERVELAYDALTLGRGLTAGGAMEALHAAYDRGETDEFVKPTVIVDGEGRPRGVVEKGDAVIFYNFRPDRARELTRAFVDRDFQGFERKKKVENLYFVCMTQYDKTIEAPVAFKPEVMVNTLGEYLSKQGLRQMRMAETEKYAHVTFFFNGGIEPPYPGEDRRLIPSPKVPTYDLKPEMSAYEVTDAFLEELATDKYDVFVVNYANPDMVGHTGVMEAAVKAVEAVDRCLERAVTAVLERGGLAIVTADHGNAEKMVDPETGQPHTAHTTSPVPFILVDEERKGCRLREGGALEDVAPTILELLELEKPVEMTGRSLLQLEKS